jgi:prephenate dehydrogenase
MIERIAILGTGLLGTSVGLGLRAAGFRGSITGWNRSPDHAQTALSMGAIDSIAADPLQAARESQVVLLAVPIYATLDFMEKLAGVLGSEHLVTDVGSTKRRSPPLPAASSTLRSARRFFPAIPWRARSAAARRWAMQIFFAARSGCLPTIRTWQRSPHSAELVKGWREWVAAMGSKTLDLDPARHDELVAWVSHLPQFVATALSALLEEEVGDAPELKDVGGRALREMTRLGASPYSMWRDIAYTNTEAVQAALLEALEQRLAHLRENLRTPELRDEFEQANRFRLRLEPCGQRSQSLA